MKIKSESVAKNYHRFTRTVKSNSLQQDFFICSDVHYDNPKTRRDLFHSHMKEAVDKDALIIIHGDLLCLMEGKYDRRSSKNILPENTGSNYLDLVIKNTARDLAPYAKNICLITTGNHESAVSDKNETHILERLVERLNMVEGANVSLGAYDGYYTFIAKLWGTCCKAVNFGYSHGRWGGVVTKGALGVSRYAAYMPDCDIHFTGHTHDGFIMTYPRLKINNYTKQVDVKKQWHVKTGTYKEEFEKGEGWAVEKIGTPKHIGGCWVTVKFHKTKETDIRINLI